MFSEKIDFILKDKEGKIIRIDYTFDYFKFLNP